MGQNRSTRKGPALAVVLTHLKVFQHVGRFLAIAELPAVAMSYVVAQARLEMPDDFGYDRRTPYRHHRAVREFLGITPWGAKARDIASRAIAAAAEARVDPADLIKYILSIGPSDNARHSIRPEIQKQVSLCQPTAEIPSTKDCSSELCVGRVVLSA